MVDNSTTRGRRAYSLIEILLGAGVLAAFILRVYQAYASTSESDKYDAFLNEMNLIFSIAQQQYLSGSDYSNVSTDTIAAVLPKGLQDDSGSTVQLRSVYHTDVNLTAADTRRGETILAGGALEIDVGVTQQACARLVSNVHELMDFIAVDGVAYGAASSVSNAVSSCGGTSTTDIVPIKIYYTSRLPLYAGTP